MASPFEYKHQSVRILSQHLTWARDVKNNIGQLRSCAWFPCQAATAFSMLQAIELRLRDTKSQHNDQEVKWEFEPRFFHLQS